MSSQTERDHQQHLKKVGLEGFALIEECYGRNRRPVQSQTRLDHQSLYYYQVQRQQLSYVRHVPQVFTVTKEPVTNYHGTSQHQYYGGRRSISEAPQVSVAKESVVVSSNEAAQLYGGTMVIDYGKTNRLRRPYY